MSERLEFPLRTVHLDFHTGPNIPDVGVDFDPDEFAETFARAHVDSVTVFAKCHHGHLYYDTNRPERHPGLVPGLDLLGEQIDALHKRGIRAPIYISVMLDEYAANQHPEWVAIDPDGKQMKGGGPLAAGWHILDMASPYQDYLVEQIEEILDRFAPVDGVFFDICPDRPSASKWAIDKMIASELDPTDPSDRQTFARMTTHEYIARFNKIVDAAQARAGGKPIGIWYNSRPKTNLHEERKFLRHIEVECLPTGGWGYAYFPYVARFVRPLGLPTLSHTGRFHRGWGDFGGLKPEAALAYECALILSQGMTNGVGDQLHPRGRLDKATYDLIGKVYGHIKACEPWVVGGEVQSDIAVIIDPSLGDQPGKDALGLVRSLQELRCQFSLLTADDDFSGYELVIIPESTPVTPELKAKLSAHLDAGRALLVSGQAAIDENGEPILAELGFEAQGLSPYTTTYLRPERPIADGIPDFDHVMYEKGYRMTPIDGSESLCRVVEPYFERSYRHFCSHVQTPPSGPSPYSAIVQKGRAITSAVPLFTAYGKYGNKPIRQIIGNCIARLLPNPLVKAGGPALLETSVVKKGTSTVVHLISFAPVRKTEHLDIVDDPFPLIDVPVAVKAATRPSRVYLAPSITELPWEYRDGYVEISVTSLNGHVMLVCES